ncbi:unnamed protein product [Alopecurus aequalis]
MQLRRPAAVLPWRGNNAAEEGRMCCHERALMLPWEQCVQAKTNPLPDYDDELVVAEIKELFNRFLEINRKASSSKTRDALDHKRTDGADSPSTDLVVDDAVQEHTRKAISSVSDDVDVAAVEAVLGYAFENKAQLEAALTHTSFSAAGRRPADAVPTFKRLEFIGDKVISLVVTRRLLSKSDDSLTRLHNLNVDNEKLARAAVAHGLHRFLRHQVPSFQRHVDDFAEEIAGYPLHSNGQAWTPKLLSDIVESLIGAVYIDSNNTEQVWQVFQRLADPLIGPEEMATIGKQPMAEFNELNQKMRVKAKIDKREWAKSGTVKVVLAGETIGSATYARSKDVAKNRAVKSALDMIKQKITGRPKFPSQVWRKK